MMKPGKGRPRYLTEERCNEMANKWVNSDAYARKQLLNEYGVNKLTFYRSLKYYGLQILTTKTLM